MSLLDLLLIIADDTIVMLTEESQSLPDYVGSVGDIQDLMQYHNCLVTHHIEFVNKVLVIEYARLCGFV